MLVLAALSIPLSIHSVVTGDRPLTTAALTDQNLNPEIFTDNSRDQEDES
jgi:hypothetical protein